MHDEHRGFTIVEVLVSIAILGLLAAVLSPAVQQSRESARVMQCRNHLKQFGVAIANFESTHGVYPTALAYPLVGVPKQPATWRLLPSLGFPAVRDELVELYQTGVPRFPDCSIPLFHCPSDPWTEDTFGDSNYLMNDGTKFRDHDPTNGYRNGTSRDTRPSDVSDGSSHTAAMSERLVGRTRVPLAEMERDSKRYLWFTQTRYGTRGQELLAVTECRSGRTTPYPQFMTPGLFHYIESENGYDHLLLPNEIGCFNGPEDFNSTNNKYLIPATSQHPGGVNVLFLDGSVRFVSDHVDEQVWRAIGTISGNETVGSEF